MKNLNIAAIESQLTREFSKQSRKESVAREASSRRNSDDFRSDKSFKKGHSRNSMRGQWYELSH